MKNLISIGEMAKLNNLTIQRLRYYDNIGLFSPVYIDETSKYRYYEKSQSRLLEKIQSLQYIGFSLHEIKLLLQDNNQNFETLLDKKMMILDEKERKIHRKKDILNNYKRGLNHIPVADEINICAYNSFFMVTIPSKIHNFISLNDDEFLIRLTDIKKVTDNYKLSRGFIPYIYLPTANLTQQSLIFKTTDQIKQNNKKEIPASQYYCIYTTCDNINVAIEELSKKAGTQGLDFFIEPLSELNNDHKQKYAIYHRLKKE
ncbi:DNA-binding transcriptional MerR regulator [Breznakia sp. PF5-3]|uniref:MerR family transcriptional regulator n=1 Tax=unclassified Breznakia TaxID=2623764 RepID=UPI002404CB23|nr:MULTISPECIES: MerR family transcriptional regulator [unclassified Breznakia]MDF9824182.1 DNA-binding transcriptional MerR regulator [Breznakia sp. PM6-1]MDF9834980.1 DNA-binding transcriptional MerR regulator [Breznakia sp. PF5-3]MDF9837151.1 DNA-binding transcriptional MerR regulator [Breznakia sp. PFB2-8]MDF9859141.1 DNA-binding transcriptional MerR regulator [Breznakia sp. PH5-24]